ncbi:MAG: tetratricopeptide repeat protein [Myxococcus sp.]|nr:tetratricopeptide repeat protein [Myxococcus sp.]
MIALTLSLVLAYTPQEAQALFTEANDAYYRQEYPVAVEKYQRLLAAEQGGPDVLFNLGTAHLAANELGPAVLFLTRASRLSPDDDVAAQLAVAQQRQLDQVVGAQESDPFLQRLARAVDDRPITLGFVAAWWLAFGLLLAFVRAPAGRRWVLGLVTAGAFFVSTALGAVVGVQVWVAQSVREAVVTAPTAAAREFPGESAKVAFEVHAGLLVRVMEDTGRFVRIRLPNALEGWVEKTQVAPL